MAPLSHEPEKREVALLVAPQDELRAQLAEILQSEGLRVHDLESATGAALSESTLLVFADGDGSRADSLSEVCERMRLQAPSAWLLVFAPPGAPRLHESLETAGADDVAPWTPDPLALAQRIRHGLRHQRRMASLNSLHDNDAQLLRLAGIATWLFDPSRDAWRPSPEMLALCGLEPASAGVPATSIEAVVHPDDWSALRAALDGVRDAGTTFCTQHRVTRPDGSHRFVESRGELVEGPAGALVQGVSLDITRLSDAHERMRYLVHYDPLTGLANRACLDGALTRFCERAQQRGECFGVLHLGLDGFKRINKAFGRAFGDEVLRRVSERLLSTIRVGDLLALTADEICGPTVGRFSSDEFTILVPNLASEHDGARIARRVLDAISHPVSFAGHECPISACIGIAIGPTDAAEPQALLNNALEAMYQAKERGKHQYQFFSAPRQREAYAQLVLEARLRAAVEAGDIVLHYQPKVDAATRRLTGLEALSRWHDRELGIIEPLEFIPVAEKTGLIDAIGLHTVQTACRQMVAWHDAGLQPGRIAVNVSPKQFLSPSFGDWLLDEVARSGLAPEYVEIEITESCVMQWQSAAATLSKLREHGITVALDDFGTGYSSLQYLRQLPIDCLKIDRAFIKDLSHDDVARSLTATILSLARSLELRVVAEGVETDEQWRFLLDHGCDEIQGFRFSRPIPVDDVDDLLSQLCPAPVRGVRGDV